MRRSDMVSPLWVKVASSGAFAAAASARRHSSVNRA
jgi:hypothetical protein